MSSKIVPFYTQAALLDKFIHAENPSSDPDAVKVIVNLLRIKDDLRFYFFRSNPSAAWASILWENDFFSHPPEIEKTENGYSIRPWDVQYFLISVAPQVPDLVIRHVNTISGHGWYLARAIEALCKVPVTYSEMVLNRMIEWLTDPEIVGFIYNETLELMDLLLQHDRVKSTLILFDALFAPREFPNSSRSLFDSERELFGSKQRPQAMFERLKINHSSEVAPILEKHLVSSLRKEALKSNNPKIEFSLSWRSAIEDTDQDILNTYNDQILCALRDTLEILAMSNQNEFTVVVKRYLNENHIILRRLGLYLLRKQLKMFGTEISYELINRTNLDDISIHHEYLMMLANGFPFLLESEKESIIKMILDGPDIVKFNRIANMFQNDPGFNRVEWLSTQKKLWIRDRLWMIKENLNDQNKKILDELINESRVPKHPAFLSWTSGGFTISDVSPFSQQDLENLSSEELLMTVKSWKPNKIERFGPERITYAGFANEIAKIVCPHMEKYASNINEIAIVRPEFALEILSRWANLEYKAQILWPIVIDLCKNLLNHQIVWSNEKGNSYDEEPWRSVRMAIVRMFKVGVSNHEKAIPLHYIEDVQDLLLKLVDDPDPTLEDDRPSEGWFGYNDPGTVALNHVRPLALDALIISVDFNFKNTVQGEIESQTVRRLPVRLQEKFYKMLDPRNEPSRAVRSVFGLLFPVLYWVDKDWTIKEIDRIFPIENDEESKWLFASAWDSYILNRYWPELFNIMLPKYGRAIDLVTKGYVTESHLHQTAQLAAHLFFDYLFSDYDINSTIGQNSLISKILNQAAPEIRSKVPWALWRILVDNPNELPRFWPRAKSLWEWREKESAISNHSPDFNGEISEFAWLLQAAPSDESISNLRLLLDGLLPHMRNAESQDTSWNSVEIFLAKHVENDWMNAIRFFRSMCEQKITPPRWVYHSEYAKKIIEISLEHQESRTDALALIDYFAGHWKDYTYKELYTKYSS